MLRQTANRLVFTGALLLLGLTGTLVPAEETLRVTRNIPGDSKPIVLYADDVATWTEGGQRVVLLHGQVLIEHGLLNARCELAAIWVDEDGFHRTRIMHVQVYAEDDVTLEDGSKTQKVPKALIDLNTRGELKIKSQRNKINQNPQLQDPLYLRGLAERSPHVENKNPPKTEPTAPGVRRTSYEENAPSLPAAPNGPASSEMPVLPTPTPAPMTAPSTANFPPVPTLPLTLPPPAVSPATGGLGQGTASPTPDPPQTNWSMPAPAPPANLPPPAVGNQPPAPGPPPAAQVNPPPGPAANPPSRLGPTLLPAPTSAVPLPPRPGGPPGANPAVPQASTNGPPRLLTLAPRTSRPFEQQSFTLPSGEQAVVVTGGVILMVRNLQNQQEVVDIEADRLVFWSKGNTTDLFSNMKRANGQASKELEFYLAGNVEIRQQTNPFDNRILRADEAYYDVSRNVAVAVSADLEMHRPGVIEPIHMKADELLQVAPNLYEGVRVEVFASRLPSDPGLKVFMAKATLQEEKTVRRTIFGTEFYNVQTDQTQVDPVRYFRGSDVYYELEDVPFFYLPFLQGSVEHPLGPLVEASFGISKIFGATLSASLDVFDLIGIEPIKGVRWRMDLDYLSSRGPALGTHLDYSGKDLFGIPSNYVGKLLAYGINDTGQDVLGGDRSGANEPHPDLRGRVLFRQDWWDLPEGFTVQAQLAPVSDRNFLEQYYKLEFDTGLNQETSIYVKQQQENWAWTMYTDARIQDWTTATEWLPRLDGWLLGVSLLDHFTYNAHASAGYAQLQPTDQGSPPVMTTQVQNNTGRFDLRQDLSLPFYLGPVKMMPYGVLELTDYTYDLDGVNQGRVYDAFGLRASMPLSRLYPKVNSELFNLNGLYHKIVISADYYNAHSNVSFTKLPQLDMLDDDATDQARRDITPLQPFFYPGATGFALENSPLFNAQTFAIRQLVMSNIDTLDTMEELNVDIRQRLQTKRGYPGMEHIVDWMILDLSATYFPNPARDNFGKDFAFLQYDYTWNIGDRTSIVSTGWYDPFPNGAQEYTVGTYFNRTDRTSFFLGYRQIEPLHSEAVTFTASYLFSPKYAMTASAVYDFGTAQALSQSLIFTRIGTDLQFSFGFNWNALQNNYGVMFMVTPNLLTYRANGAQPSGGGFNPMNH